MGGHGNTSPDSAMVVVIKWSEKPFRSSAVNHATLRIEFHPGIHADSIILAKSHSAEPAASNPPHFLLAAPFSRVAVSYTEDYIPEFSG